MVFYANTFSNQSTLIKWNQAMCSIIISRYEVQLTHECSMMDLVTHTTQTNETALSVSYNDIDCLTNECYIRVRGILIDGTYTSYSPCTTINYRITTTSFVDEGDDICVPIIKVCHGGIPSSFLINGTVVSGLQLFLSNRIIQNSTFNGLCFTNILENLVVSEFCHDDISDELSSCFICSSVNGIVNFISKADIKVISRVYSTSTTSVYQMNPLQTVFDKVSKTSYQPIYHIQTEGIQYSTVSSTYMITHHDVANNTSYGRTSILIVTSGVIGFILTIVITCVFFILICIRHKRPCAKQDRTVNIAEMDEVYPVYEEIAEADITVTMFNMEECSAYETVQCYDHVADSSMDMQTCPAYA